MSHPQNTKLYDDLNDWLEEASLERADILQDEQGYYFLDEVENGNPGDDYQIEEVKTYLPAKFQDLSL